jgi:hypothetical protein
VSYIVQVVGDDELPAGIHKVIVERDGLRPLLLINGEPARTWRFMCAYEAEVEAGCGVQVAWPAEVLLAAV